MRIYFAVACAGLQLLLFSGLSSGQQAEAERKTHTIPVGDAGVGLVVQLPPHFTMEQPQGSYFYFGAAPGSMGPEIWVYVFVEPKKVVDSTLDQAISPIERETTTMQTKPVEWLRWESANAPQRHIFNREAYLENLSEVVQDPFKAKRLKDLVVTFSIGGLDKATVDAVQKCFVEAKVQESVLPRRAHRQNMVLPKRTTISALAPIFLASLTNFATGASPATTSLMSDSLSQNKEATRLMARA